MGHALQIDVPSSSEVKVPFSNLNVYIIDKYSARIHPDVHDWLDQYAGDWGLDNWDVPEIEPEIGMKRMGRIFQFGDPKVAVYFKLRWG
jgi:hypothetical protein